MSEITWEAQNEGAPLTEASRTMPSLIWKILSGRGLVSSEEIDLHFSPKLRELSDPMSIDEMPKAVERLVRALESGEKVCIYGDFDLDGSSGLSLLKVGLADLGYKNLVHYQPKRLSEGYGFHAHAIDQFKQQGVSLVVTVDVGITAIEAVEHANSLGIDVIITDHHLPKQTLPAAVAVVNPNKGHCPSQLGHLCGAGVGFYLLLALKRELQQRGFDVSKFNPKSILDFFVIGTLTDMVPLTRENRVLVKHGLVELANSKRPGLQSLLKALGLNGRPLTSQDVAIRFAPKLNALSRMEMGLLPVDIMLETDAEKAESLVGEVLANNERRLSMQKGAEEEALEWVKTRPQKGFIWAWSKNFHQGVVGLVATKLSQKYGVPAFVGAVNSEGKITGSSRAPQSIGFNLLSALESAKDVLVNFGGHAPAAGFGLQLEQAELFEQKLTEYYADQGDEPVQITMNYEASGRLTDIDEAFMRWYEAMGPFGAEFEPPRIHLQDLQLQGVRSLRGGHLKLTLTDKADAQLKREALWFSPPKDHPGLPKEGDSGQDMQMLVEPQWNYFAGRRTLQLLIKDLKTTT